MSYVMVDVEADGPVPQIFSMIELGAIIVEPTLTKTFYGKLRPISEDYVPEALAVTGHTREETMLFDDPFQVMKDFKKWLQENSKGRPFFIADNNGFDYMFTTWYFWRFLGENPFGHSSTNLGSLIKGMNKDMWYRWKWMRDTKHTHNPVDDAKGNAEVLLKLKKEHGLRIDLI